jgi:L-aspartate oxidase
MSDHVGVLRERSGLEQALATLAPIAAGSSAAAAPALAGLLVATAAWLRTESRGGHARTDFPGHDASLARRRPLVLAEALALVDGFMPGRTLRAMSAGD